MDGYFAEFEVLAATAVAMVIGGVIGFERELKDRPAGFRTHMLVAGASALLVSVGLLAAGDGTLRPAGDAVLRLDPLRLVEAVIAGVAFIGAGTIFARRHDNSVAGITTAASLLMVAVIGITTGLGYYLLAAVAALLTLAVLSLLSLLDRHMVRGRHTGDANDRRDRQ